MAKETPAKVTPPAPAKSPNNGVRKKSQRASGLMGRIIQVKVGHREEPYQIHKKILCQTSPFFRKACDGPWKESKENWIDLPEDRSDVFEIYVQWLYLEYIDILVKPESLANSFRFICNVYKFGDKILDIDFKNAVIDSLVDITIKHSTYSANITELIYTELPSSSCLRRLHVDFWIWSANPSWYDNKYTDCKTAPMEFFKDVAKGLTQFKISGYNPDAPKPWISDICQYHEHAEGERCHKETG